MITHKAFSKKELSKELLSIFEQSFGSNMVQQKTVDQFINPIKNDAHFIVEYPYVDKVYRDSYYTYFASKLNSYPRNCIRVSIFSTSVEPEQFKSSDHHENIKKSYRGYFVVRPTQPYIFGRTTIDKRILKDDDFLICETTFPATCNGLKLNVTGFPYSSQDTETLKCAGTSLWSMMEYFSNRYPKYASVLPSNIIETLKSVRFQRQLPSIGLNYSDLSFALKAFGFGTRVYAKDQFEDDFEALLSCYIESGIPIIIAISNGENIQHAMICCGREKLNPKHFKSLTGISGAIDFDNIEKKFVFIDDNHFPYQQAYLNEPCSYYNIADWQRCKIQHFIVPLYPKIYLEAFEAKVFSVNLLQALLPLDNDIIRIMLTSSRSYKDELLRNNDLTNEFKEKIISIPMSKFIWVCEVSNKELIEDQKCFGSMVLDATEPNINLLKPLIFCHLGGQILEERKGLLYSSKLQKPLDEYSVYQNNLNGF